MGNQADRRGAGVGTGFVLKPIAEGSSVGVFLVTEAHAHPPQELTRPDWA
jgi:D-alanine-D-alanine ligase